MRYNLINFRETLGLSQEEFIKSLGFTAAYQSHIETGRREGTIGYWKAIYDTYLKDKHEEIDILFLEKKGEKNDSNN